MRIQRRSLALLAVFAMGCSEPNLEGMTEKYNRECFANTSTRCVTLKTDIAIKQVKAFLEEVRTPEVREKILAEAGKSGYRDLLIKANRELFELEARRPGWMARTFQSDDPYEWNFMSDGEKASMMSRAAEAEEKMKQVLVEIDNEIKSIPDQLNQSHDLADANQPGTDNPSSTEVAEISSEDKGHQGPSFDCSMATTNVELLICGDADLAGMDKRLSVAYAELMIASDDKGGLKSEQRAWLKEVRNQCETVECLQLAYQSQIDNFESALQYLSKPAEFR